MKTRSMLGFLAPLVFVIGCAQSDPGITTSVKTQLIADDQVKARNITVETNEGEDSEVTSGLQPGDVVVMTGADRLQEGSRVNAQIANEEQPAGRGGRK